MEELLFIVQCSSVLLGKNKIIYQVQNCSVFKVFPNQNCSLVSDLSLRNSNAVRSECHSSVTCLDIIKQRELMDNIDLKIDISN